MIRDDKMIQLVAPEKEPITPFVRLVRSLYDDVGISTVIVVGGTGDFFDVADTVLVMDSYHCVDATERAKQIVASSTSDSSMPHKASQGVVYQRSNRKRALKGGRTGILGIVRVKHDKEKFRDDCVTANGGEKKHSRTYVPSSMRNVVAPHSID